MLTKRLIACFDILNGMVTKAVQFQNNINVAPAEELALAMYKAQIDELIFYDITASSEKRKIDINTVKKVAQHVFIPFTVGGGIKDLNDMYEVLKAGAEKISVDSMAVRNPNILTEGAKAFGTQCIVLSTQVKKTNKTPSGYEVYIDGARSATGMDALEWVKRGQELGAGEICVNSIEKDGALSGYDLELMKKAESVLSVPLIASGGAGKPEHLKDLFTQTEAQAAIISSMLYSPRLEWNYPVSELKEYLLKNNINVRPYKDMDLITYLEDLSYLTLSYSEKQRLSGDLQEILNSMTQLNDIKDLTEDSFDVVNVFREDEVKNSFDRELILKNAPDRDDKMFSAPSAREGK